MDGIDVPVLYSQSMRLEQTGFVGMAPVVDSVDVIDATPSENFDEVVKGKSDVSVSLEERSLKENAMPETQVDVTLNLGSPEASSKETFLSMRIVLTLGSQMMTNNSLLQLNMLKWILK